MALKGTVEIFGQKPNGPLRYPAAVTNSLIRATSLWSTRIGAGQPIGVTQDVVAADLVVEPIEAESGLRLRLAIELSLKDPDLLRCC